MKIWVFLFATLAHGQTPAGRWDGTIAFDGLRVPFSIQLEAIGDSVKGAFYKGEHRVASTNGNFAGSVLRLNFEQFGKVFNAKLVDGKLTGTYGGQTLEASAYCTCSYEGEAGPDISGIWDLDGDLKLQVRRKEEDTFATLVSGDSDAGPHTGRFDGLQFTLNHFDGRSASILEITPQKDGSLEVIRKEPRVAVKKYRAVKVKP